MRPVDLRINVASARRSIIVLAVVAFLMLGCGAAGGTSVPASPAAPEPSSAAAPPSVSPFGGAPLPAQGVAVAGAAASGSGVAGPAIVYPYPVYPGSAGLAPDHTIVVTGFGQAPLAADGSDRAAAQQTALKAALADAKAQANTIASATGVTIKGVLSVSVSSAPIFGGPVPLPAQAAPGTAVPGGPVSPPGEPSPALGVTVTVAYRIG
jgi:hypothetical protein